MTQHTPGPWKVNQTIHNSQLKPADRRNYAGSIAYVITDRPYPHGVCIASVREELLGEVEHNAALIAAAPAMLEALKFTKSYIEEWIDMFDPSDEADADVKAAREECRQGFANLCAAIAQAEGKVTT